MDFLGKVTSLLFNMLSRFVVGVLPSSKHLFISWLQSPSAVILEPKKIKSVTVSIFFSIYLPWNNGTGKHDLNFWEHWVLSQLFQSPFAFIKTLFSSSSLSASRKSREKSNKIEGKCLKGSRIIDYFYILKATFSAIWNFLKRYVQYCVSRTVINNAYYFFLLIFTTKDRNYIILTYWWGSWCLILSKLSKTKQLINSGRYITFIIRKPINSS